MTRKLLLFLPGPERLRTEYVDLLQPRLPGVLLQTAATIDEATLEIRDAEIFIAYGATLTRHIFGGARSLKWVQALGTGLDGIVDAPDLGKDVLVTATRGIHGSAMSELAVMFMLVLVRDFLKSQDNQKGQHWVRWPARLLNGKTAGIVGVGVIAASLAPVLRAFGMRVVGVSRTPRPVDGFDEIRPRTDLPEVAREADFLLVLVPSSKDTRKLVSADILASMKPNSYLINLARGDIIDEEALTEALYGHKIAGAALDTFRNEPLPAGHPLWTAPNTVVTPHVGGFYETYARDAVKQIVANYRCYARGAFHAMSHRYSPSRPGSA